MTGKSYKLKNGPIDNSARTADQSIIFGFFDFFSIKVRVDINTAILIPYGISIDFPIGRKPLKRCTSLQFVLRSFCTQLSERCRKHGEYRRILLTPTTI
jgi:hypothetical protein